MRPFFLDLGYVVHSPAELYGSRDEAQGASDTDWLSRIKGRGWAVIGRDLKIFERPDELAAYRRAKVHIFLFPAQATRDALLRLLSDHLAAICTATTSRNVGVWKVTRRGIEPL